MPPEFTVPGKHDEACLRRRTPRTRFLCTCGLSDEQVENLGYPAMPPLPLIVTLDNGGLSRATIWALAFLAMVVLCLLYGVLFVFLLG